MALQQRRSKRKPSGKRYKSKVLVKKKVYRGHNPTHTKVGARKTKDRNARGGNVKKFLLQVDEVNLYDPKTKKHVKTKIQGIVDNPANRHFIRRGILTKGAVIKTDKGNAKITSRPGQVSTANAVLVK